MIDGVNGFLIENESESLVKKISELMKHQDVIKKVGDGARKSIYHPWEGIVDDVHLRYAELIKDRRRRM